MRKLKEVRFMEEKYYNQVVFRNRVCILHTLFFAANEALSRNRISVQVRFSVNRDEKYY